MAYTQAHLDALELALVKGEKRVTFGDKTVEYRSVDELMAAIAAVKRDLFEQAVDTGLWPGAPRQIRVGTGHEHKGDEAQDGADPGRRIEAQQTRPDEGDRGGVVGRIRDDEARQEDAEEDGA